jgi:regulation of enolase protein 1 (concanavalin A-like superfamily)
VHDHNPLVINVNLPWSAGEWTHPPISATEHGEDLLVTAAEGSDAWRLTCYGFIHDSEHALLASFPSDSGMEVEFTASFSHQFDQAGIFVRVSPERWVKAGVEFADERPHVGAIVTNERSDWSLSPVPDWLGKRVLIRVSWVGDALTIRARAEHGSFQLVRVLPFEPGLDTFAGPYICAPTRAGLTVPFHAWRTTEPDRGPH